MPVLIATYKTDRDKATRGHVMRCLALIGKDATDAIPVLMPAFQDADAAIRAEAAETLSTLAIHAEASSIVAALIAALDDEVANVRAEAAEGLGRIGPRAEAGVAALTKAKQDSNKRVQKEASEALQRIGKDKKVKTE